MTFQSILYISRDAITNEESKQPAFFKDLNLDQIVEEILYSKPEYHLKPFFYTNLRDADTVLYRHEVMQDLENDALFASLDVFAKGMHEMRTDLQRAEKLYYKHQKEWWFLEAARQYCQAVNCLAQQLNTFTLQSRGMTSFREFLDNYVQSETFSTLLAEVDAAFSALKTVKYCMLVKGNTIQVRNYDDEQDYSIEVIQTFEKFKQKEAKGYVSKFEKSLDMDHIEAGILHFISMLYPEVFKKLDDFNNHHADYLDQTIAAFDREIQFYMSYRTFIEKFQKEGFSFCYPQVSRESKEVYVNNDFDLAMAANRLRFDHSLSAIIRNDFYLKGKERIIIVSGPNQGGKTTFARTFGQLHFLASLGLPVPGSSAKLFLFDHIYTQFERAENIENLRGKLQDDLVRIHDILEQASTNSLILMNEVFSSTTLQDAVLLGKNVMNKIIQLDALCVYITFLDELSTMGDTTVSMVSTVVSGHPDSRTFKVIRRPADGLSYAQTIAKKYRLTYKDIKERIPS